MTITRQEITRAGLRVILSTPRVVAETSGGRCWYPDLLKFSTGELMLNHSLNADRHDNEHNSQAVYLSVDEGRTFDFAYDVNGFHNGGGEPRISLPDGRIVGASSFLRPGPSPQGQSFLAHHWCYDQGGGRYAVEPWSVVVEGFPREVDRWRLSSRNLMDHDQLVQRHPGRRRRCVAEPDESQVLRRRTVDRRGRGVPR